MLTNPVARNTGSDEPSPILVTGAHRSGTTWTAKMIAAHEDVAYISEPLNIHHRGGVLSAPVKYWYTYICQENESELLPAFYDTLNFQYHLVAEIRSIKSLKDFLRMGRDLSTYTLGKLRDQIPLIKDPFAVFSVPWLHERLACRIVIVIRHPAAFISSLMRLNWSFDFTHLLDQSLLMADLLEPYRDKMEDMRNNQDDILGQGALLWSIIYQTVRRFHIKFPHFIIRRHEDLALEPLNMFREIYDALELEYSPRVQEVVRRSSNPKNPAELAKGNVHGIKLDSEKSIYNWKNRLDDRQIERVYNLTQEVATHFYSDEEW